MIPNNGHDISPMHQLAINENKRLLSELEAIRRDLQKTRKENELLKHTIEVWREDIRTGRAMGTYMNNVKDGYSKPALKEHASIEAIVKIIQEEGITNLAQIGNKLGVSYGTVRRRLIDSNLYPINKGDIREYYHLFDIGNYGVRGG